MCLGYYIKLEINEETERMESKCEINIETVEEEPLRWIRGGGKRKLRTMLEKCSF